MLEDIDKELITFYNRLDSIKEYINLIETEKELLKIDIESEKSNFKEQFSKIIMSIKNNKNSQVVYNAIIISLYSCYENYIDSILTKYLEKFSVLNIPYKKLPKQILDNHITFVGNFLSNNHRYKNYELEQADVINNLNNCLSNDNEYHLNSRILITHSGNLGIEALNKLFTQVGITNLFGKIKENKEYSNYYGIQNEIKDENEVKRILSNSNDEIIFYILQDLVNRRNGIAHTWNEDERISIETIKEKYIEFFIIFGKSIHDVIISEIYNILYKNKKLFEFKIIHKVIDNKIVCLNNGNQKIILNSYLYVVKTTGKGYAMRIENIQQNNNDIKKTAKNNADIGIKVDGYIKTSDKFFYFGADIQV